ncbi:cytochrome c oxidase assembly factor CtaG [Virgibacillus sediminis]|uniref:Cytochrome c oxidase assembly factor CtaG n=1 Tax=Virgibacillus sediminis TaxID=202260 RepID=A0ABV7ABA8_9BACI
MWLELQIFGFRALWSPYFALFILMLAVVYYLVTGPYRYKFGDVEEPDHRQKWLFYSALVLLYVVKGSPIDLLSHITLTGHMIQMAGYLLIFPILIIKGLPVWIWEKLLFAPIVKPVIRLLTKPVISLLLFNAIFSVYHIPVIFDFSKSSPAAHAIIHGVLLLSAFIMWLPITAPVKELDRMKPMLKILYIFANGVLITPACVLIIFASEPLYAAYSQSGAWVQALSLCVPGDVLQGISIPLSGPEIFSPMSTMLDQQLGGIIMKVIQEITYGVILARVFLQWSSEDNGKIDPAPAQTH